MDDRDAHEDAVTPFLTRRGVWGAELVGQYEAPEPASDRAGEANDALVAAVRVEIRNLFEPPDHARTEMERYLDRFDGRFFEPIADDEHPHEFTARDLLALGALSMPDTPPGAIVRILDEDRDELSELLRAVPNDVDLWKAKQADLDAATKLWRYLKRYPGFDNAPVRKSKLIAAKRPRLVPIYSQEVREVLGVTIESQWATLRSALDPATRRMIDVATPNVARERELSLLRRLDIVVWRAGKSTSNPGVTRFG